MTLQVGDFFVTRTGGFLAQIIRWGTSSTVNHAGVYLGNGIILEAEPGGSRYNHISAYPNAIWSSGKILLTDEQRLKILKDAPNFLGIPYGYLDIVAIAFAQSRLGKRINKLAPMNKQPWWVRRILNDDEVTDICSQLTDLQYQDVDCHLFNDGRLPGLVSPGDLLTLILNA